MRLARAWARFRGRRFGDWRLSYSGRKMYPLDPSATDLDITDIAHHLSLICRYGGSASRFYSVAEHSVIVSHHVPAEYALEGLLHDASEYVLGDVVRPLKHMPAMVGYRRVEAEWERVIAWWYGLDTSPAALAAVKAIDDRILSDERHALLPAHAPWHPERTRAPLGCRIRCLSPMAAESLFTLRFLELIDKI